MLIKRIIYRNAKTWNSIHKGNNYCKNAINILKYIMNIIILLRSNNSTDKLLSTTRPLHEIIITGLEYGLIIVIRILLYT